MLQDHSLENELGWETLQKRSEILGLCIFQKIHTHDTRPLIKRCIRVGDSTKAI